MTILTGPADGKSRRKISCLLFDLDDTLYRSPGVGKQVLAGIHGYMIRHLGFSQQEAVDKATHLYQTAGTTLAGLVEGGHRIDYDHWHKEVHYGHVDYDSLIQPDPALREMLFAMDLPKYVLTNADVKHAEICLQRLGIRDCFQGMFHFEFFHQAATDAGLTSPESPRVVCKPSAAAYDLVFKRLGVRPEEALFFDDSVRNIRGAHDLGIMTVLVGTDQATPGADLCIPDLHHLPRVLPELIDQPGVVKQSPRHHRDQVVPVTAG